MALISFLDNRTIQYLEDGRQSNEKGDIILNVDFLLTYLKSNSRISHLHFLDPKEIKYQQINIQNYEDAKLVFHKYDRDYLPDYNF